MLFQPINLSFSIRVKSYKEDVEPTPDNPYFTTRVFKFKFEPSLDVKYIHITLDDDPNAAAASGAAAGASGASGAAAGAPPPPPPPPKYFVTNVSMSHLTHTIFNGHQCSTTIQPFT